MKLVDKVKKRLEEDYGIDFLSEFWTDDQLVLLEEIVNATQRELLKTFPMPSVIEAMERVQDLIVRSQPKQNK